MNEIDITGVENTACALIKQAKKDFIKGAQIIYLKIRPSMTIPTYSELLKNDRLRTLANNNTIRWMYDSWVFVKNDPYTLFSPGEESVINAWTKEAVLDLYRSWYVKAGAILYKLKAPKRIQSMDYDDVIKLVQDKEIASNFIEARMYVATLPNKKEIYHEWNVMAHAKSHKTLVRGKKSEIQNTEYFKKNKEKRAKNISKAKELEKLGLSVDEIAKDLGVTRSAVWNYLRS